MPGERTSSLPTEYSEGWKNPFPVGQTAQAPLLINRLQEQEIGPTIFRPCPETLVGLYSSPSLCPRLPLPNPRLSLTRFLSTSDSTLLPSDVSAIASEFGLQHGLDFTHSFDYLKLLSCESDGTSFDLAFFPTGDNCDKVGCLKICFNTDSKNVRVFTAREGLYSRILKLLVNPASDDYIEENILGYVMACTTYSANWYLVRSGCDCFDIELIGHCVVGNGVVNACWSPHIYEESIVLTETGELYLFDVTSCVGGSCNKVERKKLQVQWDLKDTSWVAVEFSWHPRIVIVVNASAVLLVDFKSSDENCNVSYLMKIEMLDYVSDRFLALCRAGSSGFNFCVSSRNLLVLCDVMIPNVPVLKWVHSLPDPCYVTVFGLSELRRTNAKEDRFKWATESGSCILLGSFWNSDFSLFVYGPKSSTLSSSYAWGLDYRFSMLENSAHCSDCFVRGEFSKEALPHGVDWRQKMEFVTGFSILSRDDSRPETNGFGGFTLIRLLSSGKVEAMRYEAVWELDHKNCDEVHPKTLCDSQSDCLYDLMEEEYRPPKNTSYLNLKFLGEYLRVNLDRIIAGEMNNSQLVSSLEEISDEMDKESNSSELPGFGSVSRICEILKNINLPTSVHEIAVSSTLTNMPQYLAHFFAGEDQARLPPHFLLTLHRLYMDRETGTRRHSVDDEMQHQCNRVMEAANELIKGSNSETDSQDAVSLGADSDDLGTKNKDEKLAFYEPVVTFDHFRFGNDRFTKFVHPKQELNSNVDPALDGSELLNAGMLKFSDPAILFESKELKMFQILKQDYLSRINNT